MLYGKDNLPTDPNIPNLIALFNKPWQEQSPKYLLRKHWIIQDTGVVNMLHLDTELQSASEQIT
jgi:hypothetical protein